MPADKIPEGRAPVHAAYIEVVRLLVQVAPVVFSVAGFALKGGTAINMFLRDMPRLSVDLDLVMVDHHAKRDIAIAEIGKSVHEMAERLQRMGLQTIIPSNTQGEEVKLFIRRGRIEVKVEINPVWRGTLLPVSTVHLAQAAQDQLKADLRLPLLNVDEVYAGKLVAAMDRGHPRDWFDVLGLLNHGGITPAITHAFVAYLAGHHRPIEEVLFRPSKPLRGVFEREFVGMTTQPIDLQTLEDVQAQVRKNLPQMLSQQERLFLLSMMEGTPQWQLMAFPHLYDLPALRWRLHNVQKLQAQNPRKFKAQISLLRSLLEYE